ncbi:hypothetical protein BB559_004803 [Furculomyces boomerangus]|uniref:Uncharacterized protein n=2 Tax=Harpellales TaxID=61421 RepID=A0A2T9YCL7_9FUNG|nr:hypothetical protein BB559_004803 [Furculomyces boomerangus]PWA02887.1 hypothetical protein BB558_000935 [Smittium angustum]
MPRFNGFSNDLILTFGDSITEFGSLVDNSGWVLQLSSYYNRKFDVLNRGFAGYNTKIAKKVFFNLFPKNSDSLPDKKTNIELDSYDSLYKIFDQQLQTKSPAVIKLVTIFFGANDATTTDFPQHVPLDEYKQNIIDMVNHIKDPASEYYMPETKVILITPPPICEAMWGAKLLELGYPTTNRTNERAKMYADALIEVGETLNVPVINLWKEFMQKIEELRSNHDPNNPTENFENNIESGKFGFDRFLYDGLHPNSGGNDLIFNSLKKTIAENYPDLVADNTPTLLPLWNEINIKLHS